MELYGARPIAIASGGLFEHYPEIMRANIARYSSAELITCELPPIYGACRNAVALGEAREGEEFFKIFKKTYGEIKL